MRILKSYLGSVCIFKRDKNCVQEYGLIIDLDFKRGLCKVFNPSEDSPITVTSFKNIRAIGPRPNFGLLFKKIK